MTLIAARGLTAEWLSDELGRRIGALDAACPPGRRVVGIEHEYAVFRGKAQLDFASIVHDLGIPGERLHPTNGDMYLTASGSAVMADGLVAEIATPPVEIAPGFTRALQGSLTTTGHLLGAALTDGDRLEGGSTHISVQIDHTAADRAAARFARTYAAPLMLLMDRAHSPGLLVRPRPGRLEFGGEYLTGRELRVASVFAVAAVATIERHVLTGDHGLPPLLDVALEPARRRYGWYVDRSAYGPDLYAEGRRARLALAGGGSVSAQRYLAYTWQMIRPTAAVLVSKTELRLVDRVVDGRDPLPLETDTHELGIPTGHERVRRHPIGRALGVRERPGFTIAPVSATWDWMAFRAADDGSTAVVVTPRANLATFLDQLEAGRLDDLIDSYLAASPSGRVLRLDAQTEHAGLHDDIEPGPALLPLDRYGIGIGPVSTVRPGKRLPATQPQHVGERNIRTVPTIAVLLIGILSLLAAVVGLHADAQAQDDGPDPRARVEAIDAVLDRDGQLWLRVVFDEPWGAVPPRDVFSLFVALSVDAAGQGMFVGWQTHDAVEEPYSDHPSFILADGSIVFATGIVDPAGGVDVFVEYGSWQDETTTSAIFSSADFSIAPDAVVAADFAASGGAVFDLLTGTPMVAATTVVSSTTIQASAGSEPTTTSLGGSTAEPASSATTTTDLGGSTAEPASSVTTTTSASGSPAPSSPTGVTDSGTSGPNPLGPVLIGLGLLLIAIGVLILRRPEGGSSVSIPAGFEKGNVDGPALQLRAPGNNSG